MQHSAVGERPATQGVRHSLRLGTAELHEAVEQSLALAAPHPSLQDYGLALGVLQRVYGAVVRFSEGIPWADAATASQRRLSKHLERLNRDIETVAALGFIGPDVAQPAMAPPVHFGPCERLGMLYVVEGSTLGGQFTSRHLARALPLLPQRGLQFFYGDGPETGALWKRFCTELSAQVVGEAAIVQAVVGARWVFEQILQEAEAARQVRP